MKQQLRLTLGVLASLGATAHADIDNDLGGESVAASVQLTSSHRGVAEDYLVLPSGGELSTRLRLLTAEPALGDAKLKLTDLALFGITGRWSLFTRLEVSATVDLLPKQPSYTDEKVWQSVGVGLRSPLGRRAAIALTGGGGHLIDHSGMWTRESLTLEWKKPLNAFVAFNIQGGVNAIGLRAPKTTPSTAFISELALATTAQFREPSGHWGGWLGVSYALPVYSRGHDPTTELAIDPQPRLDIHLGTVLAVVKQWDLYLDLAVIDRGDLANPATRLPILDGGFDQRQISLGVTRHFEGRKRSSTSEGPLQLGSL